jgi:hypothetical protein
MNYILVTQLNSLFLLFHVWKFVFSSQRKNTDSEVSLDIGLDGVVRWKSPASEMFLQLAKHVKVREGRVGVERCVGCRNGFGRRTRPFTARDWKISSYVIKSRKIKLMCKYILVPFFVFTYLRSPKKWENLLSDLPSYILGNKRNGK